MVCAFEGKPASLGIVLPLANDPESTETYDYFHVLRGLAVLTGWITFMCYSGGEAVSTTMKFLIRTHLKLEVLLRDVLVNQRFASLPLHILIRTLPLPTARL